VKRAGDVAQVVAHLPPKHKALSSNTSTEKKKLSRKKKTVMEQGLTVVLESKARGLLVERW
jgi:hypothetical protein